MCSLLGLTGAPTVAASASSSWDPTKCTPSPLLPPLRFAKDGACRWSAKRTMASTTADAEPLLAEAEALLAPQPDAASCQSTWARHTHAKHVDTES